MWLFELFFSQFCKSDMSRYRYLEVFKSLGIRDNESRLYSQIILGNQMGLFKYGKELRCRNI